MFKNKQLINSDSDQSLTATTTTFETFEANEPTNNFGQSGKRVKQVNRGTSQMKKVQSQRKKEHALCYL